VTTRRASPTARALAHRPTREPAYSPLPTFEEARERLYELGVPWDNMARSQGLSPDLTRLLCSLDQLGSTCGRAGVHWFLTRTHLELGGRRPADVVGDPDGVDRIQRVVELELFGVRG
jgi:hypothetical protein